MSHSLPQAPVPATPAPAHSNGIAVAGFVVALVAVALCLVPIVNNVAFLLALVGLVLAILGLVKARRGAPRRGLAVAGIILSVLAGVGVLASQAYYSSVIDDVSESLDDTPAAAATADDDAESAEPADDAAEDAAAEPTEEPTEEAEAGTRANPYRFSDTVGNDDWTIDLGKPREAWDDVRAENQFNDAPADGMEYWIVPVEATYTGTESATPWVELTVEFVGDDSVTYSDRCGVIPDDLMDVGELYEGGTGTGNVCLAVPAGAEGSWTLTAGWFSDPVFFRAKG
ncbi:hypothetical protein ATJ88_1081 [Isoptericola jiangsuensis]|uniref:DUF4190 domain-containing protein n=1 Tax=Isoptericola jiangsuensis TaxID=548579 RepID=A0A2A9EVV6_9MICO|nr:hypothetical protein [Isoptericola jiangsuensis]PFG42420.1 hypothetical protein ATJ88_1081 [Isoptericola jiangsuensis]